MALRRPRHLELSEGERIALRRERVTMALYVSITLLAGLGFADEGWAERDVVGLVWGTTVGLALAHWLAFALANRLVDPDRDRQMVLRELVAQMTGATAVAAVVTLVVALVAEDHQRGAAQVAVIGLIGVIVVRLARSYGSSWGRSLRGAAAAVALAVLVAGLKEALIQ